ncbi:hypothetical protein V1512DRAFT_242664 [Lipomyces arxii]|uniref:uncharacterized protein n=1 Tax=Lipomyces arxii TaxID=56418 RepID=UPI0034CD266E
MATAHPSSSTIIAERIPETEDYIDNLWSSTLLCSVSDPQKEQEGTQNAYISYLVTTESDFPTFQEPKFHVRRRFSDFVFFYNVIVRTHPACAVPPLPDKQRLEYITGDRFGPEFTLRRASSLHLFLQRVSNHPILRRAPVLLAFLESQSWNGYMREQQHRLTSQVESTGVFDGLSDVLINAFARIPKDKDNFIPAKQRMDKLGDNVSHTEKVMSRLIRHEQEWEADSYEFGNQVAKLAELELEMADVFRAFAKQNRAVGEAVFNLRESVDTNYVTSLRDMETYVLSVKQLLKQREQKQLDHEALLDYLHKATVERDVLASGGGNGFLRSKVEDLRRVDHNIARIERLRKLDARLEVLKEEAKQANEETDAFDKETMRDLVDFERIKGLEMKESLGRLADDHIEFFRTLIEKWEETIPELEK